MKTIHMNLSSAEKIWKKKFSEAATKEKEFSQICLASPEGVDATVDYFFRYFRPYIEADNSSTAILDLGCGPGIFCRALSQLGYRVYGIDYSEPMIEVAKRETKDPTIEYQVGDVYDIPFENDMFDTIICLGVFQTVEDIEKGLREIRSKLKPNGLLVITTLNKFSAITLFRRVLGQETELQPRQYSSADFAYVLRKSGFNSISVKGVYVFPRSFSWLTHLISKVKLYAMLNKLWFLSSPLSHHFYIEAKATKSKSKP